MPDSSNPPSPSSGAPSPRKAKPATIDSPHIDGRKWGKGGYIQAGLGTTAVEVYYEGFSINDADARLNALDEDDLHRHCTDLARLREVITAYRRKKSYKKGNIQLILDWYGDPGKMNAPVIQRGATTDGTNTKPPIDAAPTQPSPYARLRAGK
jgi:hypothetical protein